MDISKWLCDTTLSPPPRPTNRDQANIPAADTRVVWSPPQIERNKRSHPVRDSSVIEVPRESGHGHKRRRHQKPSQLRSSESGTSREHDNSSSLNESVAADEESASTDTNERRKYIVKSYERRPRHKTRPDKYLPKEPKPEKTKSRHDRRKDAKTRKRKKRDKPPAESMDLVKNFKTRHVANARLTLLPNVKSGLYKQGCTSAPVRGKGLPDLTFSEMNFLKKSDHGHEDSIEKQFSRAKKDKKRRDQRLNHELEISTYFGVTNDRDIDRADSTKRHKIPNSNAEIQHNVERHPTRRRVARHRTSTRYQRESSIGYDIGRPSTESVGGVTGIESLPVGTYESTKDQHRAVSMVPTTRMDNQPRIPVDDHRIEENKRETVQQYDRSEIATGDKVQRVDQDRDPDRRQTSFNVRLDLPSRPDRIRLMTQDDSALPTQETTAKESIAVRQSKPSADRPSPWPYLEQGTRGDVPVEKSSSSPLSKALRGCEHISRTVAFPSRVGYRVSRPNYQPTARGRSEFAWQRSYHSPVSNPYAATPCLTISPDEEWQRGISRMDSNAFLYKPDMARFEQSIPYIYEENYAGLENDMDEEIITWNQPLVQEDLSQNRDRVWLDEAELCGQDQNIDYTMQDREAVNETKDGTILDGFWEPNRLY